MQEISANLKDGCYPRPGNNQGCRCSEKDANGHDVAKIYNTGELSDRSIIKIVDVIFRLGVSHRRCQALKIDIVISFETLLLLKNKHLHPASNRLTHQAAKTSHCRDDKLRKQSAAQIVGRDKQRCESRAPLHVLVSRCRCRALAVALVNREPSNGGCGDDDDAMRSTRALIKIATASGKTRRSVNLFD